MASAGLCQHRAIAMRQLLFLISPDRDHQRERNTPKHCRHQHAEEVSLEFQIDQEHGRINAAAAIPASWHTAISVSRFIGTDAPKVVAETGRTLPPGPSQTQRNATLPSRIVTEDSHGLADFNVNSFG